MKDLEISGHKAGSKSAHTPTIAPDSASSLTLIKEVIGLSEGEIEGFSRADVLLDGTPLTDLSSEIQCDFRFGTPDQTHIDGFDDVSNEVSVNIELKSSLPWIRAISNTTLDAIGLKLGWAPLKTQKSNGDIVGATVSYSVELSTDGGTYVEVLKATVSDKTSDNYVRYHEIALPEADTGWTIRVKRLTPDSTSDLVSDKMFIQTYSELIKSKFTYPYTALIALNYDAQMFSNIAKVAVNAKGVKIKVPSNYDPVARTYSGLWNGTFKIAYTNNPAWIYYDLCTNKRYGIGSKLKEAMIDKWALYRLSQYCDQMVDDGYGGLEPRFTCNVYIQNKERAFDILNRLSGVFRAITFWSGTQIVCDADIPQDSFYTFTNANVADGMFEYSGASVDDRYSVAKVAWDNPNNNFETEYEPIAYEHLIKELGVKVLEIDAWGCTSRGQAIRAGRWALLSEYKTVTFKVGLDGYIPVPGKVIEVMDEAIAGRANGGRVRSISADCLSVTLDRSVTVVAGDRLIINSNSGAAISRLIQSVNGSIVTVSQPFPMDLIDPQNVWVIDSNELATQKYRVLGIKANDDNSFTIDAIEYTAEKYEAIENGIIFEESPISIVKPIAQDSVQNVTIEQHSTVYQGTAKVSLIIKWERSANAVKYLVEWKKDDGSWISQPLTGNNSVEIENVYAGVYLARVTAMSAYDLTSKPTYSALTSVYAKSSNPLPPANLTTTAKLFEIDVSWDFQAGSEDTLTTRIAVSSIDPINNVIEESLLVTYDKAYPDKTLQLTGLASGAPMWFKAKVIDRLGLSSDWTAWVQGAADDGPEKVLDLISGHISESMLDQILTGKIQQGAEHTASIDGIMKVKTVTIDNNGVMSGYGLISELKDGVVTSGFGVNANTFYIGAPSGGKRPFVVLTTPGTINGVSVPAGTYIDTAYIPDATITNAKIANATIQGAKIADATIWSAQIADSAITNAKIGNAAITSAKIADLAVDTLNIANNAVTVPIYINDTATWDKTLTNAEQDTWITVSTATLAGIQAGQPVYVFVNRGAVTPSNIDQLPVYGAVQGGYGKNGYVQCALFIGETLSRFIGSNRGRTWSSSGDVFTEDASYSLSDLIMNHYFVAATANPSISIRFKVYGGRNSGSFPCVVNKKNAVTWLALGVKK